MYAVIFKAEINQFDQEYSDTARQLRELAKTEYGCLEFIALTEGQQEIAISYWENEEQIRAWKQDPIHLRAQQLGRTKWYKSYEVQIVRIERSYGTNETD